MEKTDNRKNILKIALELFAERGYQAIGIQEIVDKAKVTKPTLYHYYGSKKGLLDAILKKHYFELLEQLKIVPYYENDLIKTLTELTQVYFDYAEKNKEFFHLQLSMSFISASNEVYSVIEPYQKEFNDFMLEIFKKSVWNHGNIRNNGDILLKTLLSILNSYAFSILNGSLEKNDDLVYKVVKQYIYGIYTI